MNSIPEELAIYQADNGEIKLKEDIESETIWASLDQISSIFGRDKSVISRHIRNIFKDEELGGKNHFTNPNRGTTGAGRTDKCRLAFLPTGW